MAVQPPRDEMDGDMSSRAMPPALAKAIAKKAAVKDDGDGDERAMPPALAKAIAAKADDGDGDERAMPPQVTGPLAEINQYGYSAVAEDNSTPPWRKTADAASGPVAEGTMNASGRFPDTGVWKQV